MTKLISKLQTPIKSKDEYEIFNQTLQKLNVFNCSIISQWESQLPEYQKNLFKELMHTRRITVNYSGMKMDIPRRTVRIKRDLNK
jgi:hypothetical protein